MEIWLIASAVVVIAGLLLGWMARNNETVKLQKEQFQAAYSAGRKAYRDRQKSWFQD
jgi:hypothetical protein